MSTVQQCTFCSNVAFATRDTQPLVNRGGGWCEVERHNLEI